MVVAPAPTLVVVAPAQALGLATRVPLLTDSQLAISR
jgi:hypothetical protein